MKDGGPAFPVVPNVDEKPGYYSIAPMPHPGMSLRDYFAAKALPACFAESCREMNERGFEPDWRVGVAMDAYAMADAMLKARGE